jgi:hypothetical protein
MKKSSSKRTVVKGSSPVKHPSQESQDRTQEESVRIEDSSGQQSSEKRDGLVGYVLNPMLCPTFSRDQYELLQTQTGRDVLDWTESEALSNTKQIRLSGAN